MPKIRKPEFGRRKKVKARPRKVIAPEVKERILASVIKGDSHWTLDPDDWGLPAPDKGSRRIVFESVFGAVSANSTVFPKCSEKECVNPYHCFVENNELHLLRLEGKVPRLVFSVGKGLQTVEEFEKALLTSPSNVPAARAQRKKESLARSGAPSRKEILDAHTRACLARSLGDPRE